MKPNGQGWGGSTERTMEKRHNSPEPGVQPHPQRGQKVPTICLASQMSLRNTKPNRRPLLPNLNCFMTSNVQGVCRAWDRQGYRGLVSSCEFQRSVCVLQCGELILSQC